MVSMKDWIGRLIKPAALKQPQTSKVDKLRREVAGHPVRGLTPATLASILEAAESGDLIQQAELFEDMEEKDGHILAELGKRKRAILTLDWTIKPPRDATPAEQDDAAYVTGLLQDMSGFDDLMIDLLDGIGKGYSCCELEWQQDGKEWIISSAAQRPQSWFRLDKATRTRLLLRSTGDGEELQPFGWATHVHRTKSGYIARAGLLRCLAWPFLFKNYSIRDLAEFLEIHGLPVRLGKYPSGASDAEKTTLLNAVLEIGHAAAGIIPKEMEIDFKEAATGAADPYMAMVDWCERTQSKAIVGQTLSAESAATGLGSGVANLHGGVMRDLTISDARQLANTITRDIIYPLRVLNRPGDMSPRRALRMVFDTSESEDVTAYSDAIPKLVSVGMKIKTSWVHDKLKIPMADEYDEVLTAPKQSSPFPPGAPPPDQNAGAQARAALTATDATQQTNSLADRAADPLRTWIDKVRGMADQAESLEALRDQLLRSYGDLPSAELAKVMQLAFTAADLNGRYDVAKKAGMIAP